jgi:formylglycine-generating enzyme
MALVSRTCVDRWEAHLVKADGTAHPHNQRPEEGVRYSARASSAVFPQAYISRLEASAACEASGKRLCTLAEWYSACRGRSGLSYPYGNKQVRDKCNAGKPHLLARLFGSSPQAWSYDDFNSPKLNVEPGFLAKSGEYRECASDYGAYDMVGNLHEWVSDTVDRRLPLKLPLRDDIRAKIWVNTGNGIFMGGFYSTTSEHGRGCAFVTIAHEPKYHDYSTGFRCCRDAAPPSE